MNAEIRTRHMATNAAVLDVYIHLLSKVVAEYAKKQFDRWSADPGLDGALYPLFYISLMDASGRSCCYPEFVKRRIMMQVKRPRWSRGAHVDVRLHVVSTTSIDVCATTECVCVSAV